MDKGALAWLLAAVFTTLGVIVLLVSNNTAVFDAYQGLAKEHEPKSFALQNNVILGIAEGEVAAIISGREECTQNTPILPANHEPCTVFKNEDGYQFGVILHAKDKLIQEKWTVNKKDGKVFITRPNGFVVQKMN